MMEIYHEHLTFYQSKGAALDAIEQVSTTHSSRQL